MGKELFAYVPAGVYDNLSALTDLAYGKSHKYFVDGTPTLRDVYIDDGWKTYLVGGLRSGGKSIYALDVSDPNNFAAANVKWEFNDSSDPNEPGDDMGLTFGQPQIAAVSEDRWAVIFGNGYNSASEDAVLYIVDLADGLLIARIRTDSSPSNGLSTPYPFDKDGDGIVDVIYAGDLQGNLWKFEKNLLGTWVLGNDGKPLFKARISSTSPVQAITTQPKAALVEGKVMVYFGTGRYLEASDLTNDNMQSFYGIWDKSENLTVSRNNLLQQTIVSSTVAAGSFTAARTITNHTTTDPSNRGCYLDFPATTGEPSERIASSSLIKSFKIGLATRVIFTTSTPTSDPCEKSGTSWLMELSTNCGRLDKSPFDINGDQQFNASDLVTIGAEQGSVSGLKLKPDTGMVNEITWVEGDPSKGIAYKLLPGTSGEDVTHAHRVESIANSDDKVTPGGPPKRISWEQIQ
jgi:type IV pilus assembly protein PilY1